MGGGDSKGPARTARTCAAVLTRGASTPFRRLEDAGDARLPVRLRERRFPGPCHRHPGSAHRGAAGRSADGFGLLARVGVTSHVAKGGSRRSISPVHHPTRWRRVVVDLSPPAYV